MFHITIGTAGADPPTLEPDIHMVKAALLYADKVRLCSAHYSTDVSLEDLIAQTYEIEEMIPHMFSTPEEIATELFRSRLVRQSLQSKNPTVKDLQLRNDLKKLNAQQYEEFRRQWPSLDVESAAKEFEIRGKCRTS